MTTADLDAGAQAPRLGVGRILGNALRLCGVRLPMTAAMALTCVILVWFIEEAAIPGGSEAVDTVYADRRYSAILAASLVGIALMVVLYGLGSAAIIATIRGRSGGARRTRNVAALALLITTVSVVAGLATTAGIFLLLLPGLYLTALWTTVIPVILFEGAGYRALGRSAEMTRGYRWPLTGLWALVFIPEVISMVVPSVVPGWQPEADIWAGVLLGTAMLLVKSAVALAAYDRLTEIHAGGSASAVARVFA